MHRLSRGLLLALAVVVLGQSGCSQMRLPWKRATAKNEPASTADRYATRQEELANLADRAGGMDQAEQDRVAGQLIQEMAAEPNPVMRLAMVRALGAMNSPGSFAALQTALRDSDKDVRIKACESLARRGDSVAATALSEVVASDSDIDVRLAAARGLGQIDDPQSVRGLGVALADTDPAMQRRAIESLRNVTHRDFGNSVPAWREFVAGGSPPEAQPSLAERMRRIF